MMRRRRGRAGLGLDGAFPSLSRILFLFFFLFSWDSCGVVWCGVGGEGKIDEDGQVSVHGLNSWKAS